MKTEYEKLQKEKWQANQELLKQEDQFTNFILKTLQSFAHRYLSSKLSPEVNVNLVSQNHFELISFENDLKLVLKNKNEQLSSGVANLIKTKGIKNNPMVQNKIWVKIIHKTNSSIKLEVGASVNWDDPEFKQDKNNLVVKTNIKEFSEYIEFRNNFALLLENVCEIF